MQKKLCKYHFAICILLLSQLMSYKVADENNDRVSWFIDVISRLFLRQLNHAHKSRPILSFIQHRLKFADVLHFITSH